VRVVEGLLSFVRRLILHSQTEAHVKAQLPTFLRDRDTMGEGGGESVVAATVAFRPTEA